MRKSILSVFLLFTSIYTYAEPAFEEKIAGVYKGEIWSSGSYLGVTVFSTNPNNKVTGTYFFKGGDSEEQGVLIDCKQKLNLGALKMNRLVCTWKDTYGEGVLDILFSDDHSSFDGSWWSNGSNEKNTWKGKK